jgi:AcrR family transcriptional regulator
MRTDGSVQDARLSDLPGVGGRGRQRLIHGVGSPPVCFESGTQPSRPLPVATYSVKSAYYAIMRYSPGMASALQSFAPVRRRDQQKEQTRLDLALAACALAKTHGLANVRVPQIAAAVGVSPRTFNNYFSSKEAAIVWPAVLRAARLATTLAERPSQEPLGNALVEAVAGQYERRGQHGMSAGWLREFRILVATEPLLHGEYLKAVASGEDALALAIANRLGGEHGGLESRVLAAIVVAAERAAVLQWVRLPDASTPLVEVVRAAVGIAAAAAGRAT